MLYKDLEDLIAKGEIKEGDKLWICDYRLGDCPMDKPIRHVTPIEVVLCSNDTLPKNKRVYYSHYHFRTLTKKGTPSAKIIAPYDNTGYRSYTGVSLNIFLEEDKCRKHYRKQCELVKSEIDSAKIAYIEKLNEVLGRVNQEIIEHC